MALATLDGALRLAALAESLPTIAERGDRAVTAETAVGVAFDMLGAKN